MIIIQNMSLKLCKHAVTHVFLLDFTCNKIYVHDLATLSTIILLYISIIVPVKGDTLCVQRNEEVMQHFS